MERKIVGGAAGLDEEVACGARPCVGVGGEGGEVERVDGDLDALGGAGGEGDALPCRLVCGRVRRRRWGG